MIAKKAIRPAVALAFCLFPSFASFNFAQTQTTGGIAGRVKDQNGAPIAGAEVTVVNKATGVQHRVTTNTEGNYALQLLAPGLYRVTVSAGGFNPAVFDPVQISITETMVVNANGHGALTVADVIADPVIVRIAPPTQEDGPELGRVVASRYIRAAAADAQFHSNSWTVT